MGIRPGNNCCGNEAGLVQKFIGSAYDSVKAVSESLDEIKFIFDFMSKYDVLLCVESVDELKHVNWRASKFARVYVHGNGSKTYVDYIYIDDDVSGILPEHSQATGSWVKVNTLLGAGGGNSIPWLYNRGSANGGEVSIHVEEDAIGVSEIFINGLRKHLGIGYTYEPVSRTIQLSAPLAKGDQLVAKLIGYPALPNTPNISEFMFVNWVYNNGTSIGGETKLNPPYTFQKVPAVFINGLRKLEGQDYVVGYSDYSINFTTPLKAKDVVIVQLGGEADAISIDTHTIREALRRTYAEAGFALVIGSFEEGAKVTSNEDVVLEHKTGKGYSWQGGIPSGGKVIPAGSSPISAGGIGSDKWVDVSGITLRQPITAQAREALRRSYAEAGYNLVNGSFESGGTLVSPNDVLFQYATGKAFTGPTGVVNAGTDPSSGGFNSVEQNTLRSGLANSGGALLIKDGTITLGSIADLLALPVSSRRSGFTYIVKGYYSGTNVGGGQFYYDSNRSTENDGGSILNGFVRVIREWLIPEDFGAKSDVAESQTAYIQNAANAAALLKCPLRIGKPYSVSATQWDVAGADPYCVRTPSGLDLVFGPEGKFVQVGSPNPKSAVILICQCSNVNIWLPKIIGTRLTQPSTLPEQNHGIRILECQDVYIHKPDISNTLGDGIYIGRTWTTVGWVAPTNVTIYEPRIDRVRRNGISCCAWDNVTIVRPYITNVRDIDGVAALAPRAAIDIEPESAGDNHATLIKTRNLKIVSPTLLDCVTSFLFYIQTKSIGQDITVDVEGDMRIRAIGLDWIARPFAIQNRGVNCTGRLNIGRVIDESPKANPVDGVHWGAIIQNNASLASGLAVDINGWEVKNQESGVYAFVCVMLDTPDSYSYYQGNTKIRNIILPMGVQGSFGCRATPEVSSARALRDLSMTTALDSLQKGYNGITNVRGLNNGVIIQGPNCYFDGVTSLTSSVSGDAVYGNRFRIDNSISTTVIVDVSAKVGTFEVIKELTSNAASKITLKGISLGSNNAYRSDSSNASLVITKTGTDITTTSVVKSTGSWTAVTA